MIEGTQNKEVREEFQRMLTIGFRYAGNDAKGHVILRAPSGAEIKMASSPSSYSWRRAFRHSAAQALGLSVWQVERLLAGQSIHKSGRKQKRCGVPPQPRPSLVVADNSTRRQRLPAIGAGADLRDSAEKSVDEVRANWERIEAERIAQGEQFPWRSAA